jgi:tetratricopeptide (TPR) repeat protein
LHQYRAGELTVRIPVVLVALTSVAHADATADADQHARRGVALYNLGKYTEAIDEFEDAYKAFQSDALLFNLAQAHRKLEHCEKALTYYHQYLAGSATPALAQQVEKLLPELEAACRTRDARPEGPVLAAPIAPRVEPVSDPTAAVEAEAEPAAPAATIHVTASAIAGEILSAGNAPIAGVRGTATWLPAWFDTAELGVAASAGQMWRASAMNNATVVQLAATIVYHTDHAWGRVIAAGDLGAEYISLLGSSRDVVPGVARTSQWAPLVRGEVGI